MNDDLINNIVQDIVVALKKSLKIKKVAVLGLCGGRSVAHICQRLSESELDWSRVVVFVVDERLVSLEHAESNYNLLVQNFVTSAKIIPYIGQTQLYSQQLKKYGGRFDVALLSCGEDAHIASLFAQHIALDSKEDFVEFFDSPKLPPNRMTSSPKLLRRSGHICVLFIGKKRNAYNAFCSQNRWRVCPVKIVKSVNHSVFCDIV